MRKPAKPPQAPQASRYTAADETPLTELDVFFPPVREPPSAPQRVRAVPISQWRGLRRPRKSRKPGV